MELPFGEVSAVSAVFLPTTGPRSPFLGIFPGTPHSFCCGYGFRGPLLPLFVMICGYDRYGPLLPPWL